MLFLQNDKIHLDFYFRNTDRKSKESSLGLLIFLPLHSKDALRRISTLRPLNQSVFKCYHTIHELQCCTDVHFRDTGGRNLQCCSTFPCGFNMFRAEMEGIWSNLSVHATCCPPCSCVRGVIIGTWQTWGTFPLLKSPVLLYLDRSNF